MVRKLIEKYSHSEVHLLTALPTAGLISMPLASS